VIPVHVVLGAGGVRCLAYAGAFRALREADVQLASVSACSAGTFAAALICAGVNADRMTQIIQKMDLEKLAGPKAWVWSRLRWPFAARRRPGFPDYFRRIVDEEFPARARGEVCLGDLDIPFATAVVDLVSRDILVYSSQTHPEMPVAEALAMAVSVPGIYPPYERDGRVLVDAAIVSAAPAWLSGAHAKDPKGPIPTLVISCESPPALSRPKKLMGMIEAVLSAGVLGRDAMAMEGVSRTHMVKRVNIPAVRGYDHFDLSLEERVGLMNFGYGTMQSEMDDIHRWLDEVLATEIRTVGPDPTEAGSDHDAVAAALGRQIINNFYAEVRMGDSFGDNAIVDTSISNSVLNLGGRLDRVTQTVGESSLPDPQRNELEGLIKDLRASVEALAKSEPAAASLVAGRLDEVVSEASKKPEERNPALLQITAKGLEEAAAAVGKLTPGLMAAATAVARFVVGL
jgi:predicted acylesterase/phospholipase RssA